MAGDSLHYELAVMPFFRHDDDDDDDNNNNNNNNNIFTGHEP
jgi:hypothetical protein